MILVVMGVAGSGKSTVGRRLAGHLGFAFAEGDSYHPAANLEKMGRGMPLDDADRWPWLDRMAAEIDRWHGEGRGVVLACSALKRAYRQRLIGARPGVRLVFLRGAAAVIAGRLEARRDHFMPADLLVSQFEALEPPGADEAPIVAEVADPPDALVLTIAHALGHVEQDAGTMITIEDNSP